MSHCWELMPSKLFEPRSVCEARTERPETFKLRWPERGRIWQARPGAGRQAGTQAAVWVPAVLSLKMTGWDSWKERSLPATHSLSSTLESEGQSKHSAASQLHSHCQGLSAFPRAKSCIPFCSWPCLQGLRKGVCSDYGSGKSWEEQM